VRCHCQAPLDDRLVGCLTISALPFRPEISDLR